ncbi:MAG TPA: hypothetical protein VGE51_12770 [Fontimonas sp.]
MAWRDVLTIEAQADPIVTIRVSALVAVDNSIPAALTAVDLLDGRMRIVVELRNFDAHKAAYLARKLETIPTVASVQAARIWRREGEPAALQRARVA